MANDMYPMFQGVAKVKLKVEDHDGGDSYEFIDIVGYEYRPALRLGRRFNARPKVLNIAGTRTR